MGQGWGPIGRKVAEKEEEFEVGGTLEALRGTRGWRVVRVRVGFLQDREQPEGRDAWGREVFPLGPERAVGLLWGERLGRE